MGILIAFTMLLNAATGTPTTNTTHVGECQQWAEQVQAGPDAPIMHYMGCDDSSGVYERLPGYCNQAARRAVREGLSGEAFNVYVGNSGKGCVLADDGSWLPE